MKGMEIKDSTLRSLYCKRKYSLNTLLDIANNPTLIEVEQISNVPYRTLLRWADDGIPWRAADALAVSLGYHPGTVWGNWFNEYYDL